MTTLHHLTDVLLLVQLVAFVFFATAWGLQKITRQPVERIRLTQTAFAAIAVTLVLILTPVMPRWNLAVLQTEPIPVIESSQTIVQPTALHLPPSLSQQMPMPQNVPDSENTMQQQSYEENRANTSALSLAQVATCLSDWRFLVMVVFSFGTLVFLMQWLIGNVRLHSIVKRAVPLSSSTLQIQNAKLFMSTEIDSPFICYLFRPLIIVPTGMSKEALRFAVAHEMEHLRRRDLFTWRLLNTMRLIFWMQPLFWTLRHHVRIDQDYLADHAAAQGTDDVEDYAAMLVTLARCSRHRRSISPIVLSMADQPTFLRRRIEMLLSTQMLQTRCRRLILFGMITLLATLSLTLGTVRIHAQTEPQSKTVVGEYVEIHGKVIDETGQTVAQAKVYLQENSWNDNKIVLSDKEGKFVVPVKMSSIWGWASVHALSSDGTKLGESRFPLQEGVVAIPEMTITIKPERLITGTVVDEEGKPVQNALVAGGWDTLFPSFAKTDQNGAFQFAYPNERTMTYVAAFVPGEGLDYVCTEEINMYEGKTPPDKLKTGPFELKLAKTKPVQIRVVDEKGQPLPGMRVSPSWIRKSGEENSFSTMGIKLTEILGSTANEQGIATLTSVPERMIEKTTFIAYEPDEGILNPDGTQSYYHYTTKDWDEFDPKDEVPTIAVPREISVKGTVTLADGTPVPWALVSRKSYAQCGHGMRWTDANGVFELREVANERVNLGVESQLVRGAGLFGFSVGDGTTDKTLNIKLEKGIKLHGTVYRPDGSPAEGYHLSFYEQDPTYLKPATGEETFPEVVVRQASDYDKTNSQGRYEYILPAAYRQYEITAGLYNDAENLGFTLKDYTVQGNEDELKLDIHLTPQECPPE